MQSNYQDCLNRVLQSEGGYTNNPSDPGGPTNFGITLEDYHLYIDSNGTSTDVRNMTVDQAKTIYKSKYWDKVNADDLPSGVDYTVFDYGVNSGVTRANRVHGEFGQLEPVSVINKINDERLSFLRSLRTWPVFGKGWSTRVANVRQHSLQLASTPSTSTSWTRSEAPTMPSTDLGNVAGEFSEATGIFTTLKSFFTDNFKKHVTAVAPVAAGAASATQTNYWPYILGGSIALGLLIWLGVYLYERKYN